jgi:hypothetical protein
LSGLGVAAFAIRFNASGPSLSLDAVTLDTAPESSPVFAGQPFALSSTPAGLARWMYPFNSNPTGRPTASVFGSLGSSPDFDSRDAQYLLGWTTTNGIPAGRGATNYLIKRARVTLTIASGGQYAYSGTLRDYRTYFPTNDSRYIPPASEGVPVELFGAGYRGEYSPTEWGVDPEGGYHTNRIVYAAGFDTNGVLADVSNNVGDDATNEISAPFEVAPFAVGQSTNVAPGELMPLNSRLTFDLNLEDPLILGYLQHGLNEGKLDFMVSSLIAASFSGPPTYPNFYTIYSPLAAPDQYPILDLEGQVVRPEIDSDGDGLPDDWENFSFGSLAAGAGGDEDGDGASNQAEYQGGMKPASAASVFRLSLGETRTELRFPFAPNKQYTPEWTDDFAAWHSAGAPVAYTSEWLEKTGTNLAYPSPVRALWRDTNAPAAHRFYRVNAR